MVDKEGMLPEVITFRWEDKEGHFKTNLKTKIDMISNKMLSELIHNITKITATYLYFKFTSQYLAKGMGGK